jgi:antitoxin component HigA of HigAB toxin-antitoxin module
MEPRIIKTDEQHRQFLAEVERLAVLDLDPESAQGLRLELLAKLVEDYEKTRFAFAKPDPIDAILFRMEQQGLKQKDIAPYLGGKNRASEVLSRKRSLTLPMIRSLYEKLDIPPGLLIREPAAEYRVTGAVKRPAVKVRSHPEHAGFEGFLPLRSVLENLSLIPGKSGVYVVVWTSRSRTQFNPRSAAGRFKGRNPTHLVEMLKEKWVPGATVVYIGKAGPASSRSLRKRIRELVRFGSGKPVAHWGGRALWQLEGIWDAQIAWKPTAGDPRNVERQMIKEFVTQFGRLPYANFRR